MADNAGISKDFAAYLKDLCVVDDGEHEAEVLLLTCMDFRFFELIAKLMAEAKLTGQYDQVVLAGAALGAVVPQKPHWHQTFFDHVDLAIKLHKIKAIVVLEHRNCGAYSPKGFNLLPNNPTPADERRVHFEQVAKLHEKIPRFLGFRADLMDVPTTEDALTFDQLI